VRVLIDLFAGIGGFALGAEYAGLSFDRHFYSEIDSYACQVYGLRFPKAEALGDIRSVNWKRFREEKTGETAQVFVAGGFP